MKKLLSSVAALAISLAAPASAATLITDGSGQLTGATGVLIFGTSYDIEFVDGTCAALFDGCDSRSNFTWDAGNGSAPTQALLDQVFIGAFDTDYTLTFGCESNSFGFCQVLIPVSPPSQLPPSSQGIFFATVNSNATSDPPFDVLAFPSPFYDTSTGYYGGAQVFARFTLTPVTPAVPEPSTWAMMLLGFAAVGVSLRHRPSKLLQLA
jgi:hypothetical protein